MIAKKLRAERSSALQRALDEVDHLADEPVLLLLEQHDVGLRARAPDRPRS